MAARDPNGGGRDRLQDRAAAGRRSRACVENGSTEEEAGRRNDSAPGLRKRYSDDLEPISCAKFSTRASGAIYRMWHKWRD